ncbi:MAG: hypothetical protein IIA87_01260 [Nanoarchaeota archaeon]|nr:hypothetical protein [Nanoarchaeota archaeon]
MKRIIEYLRTIPSLVGLLPRRENKQTSRHSSNDEQERSTPIKKEFWESEDYERKLDEAWELAQELGYGGFDFHSHVRSFDHHNIIERNRDGSFKDLPYAEKSLESAIYSFRNQKKRLEEGKTQIPPGRDFITGEFLPEVDPVTGKFLPEG